MHIGDARVDDLREITAIYNQVIATTTAVFSEHPVTVLERRDWWKARTESGYPVLVAVETDDVVGFASFGEFRAWPCYRHTVEHGVHVRHDRRGMGIGTRLVEALVERATAAEKHVMIAGVEAENQRSVQMHERLGFKVAGQLHEVGWKFGRWLDLILMERMLIP